MLFLFLLIASSLLRAQESSPRQGLAGQIVVRSTAHSAADQVEVRERPLAVPPPEVTIKSAARAVLVDVVVNDRQGKLIRGLGQSDFQLTEDGHPENIASFEATDAGTGVSLAEGQSLPQIILLIDELNTRFEDIAYARYSVRQLLDRSGSVLSQPTALMILTDRGVEVLQSSTRDAKAIESALQTHRPAIPWRFGQGTGTASERINLSLSSLQQIAIASQGSDTRNVVVWVSAGIPVFSSHQISQARREKLFAAVRKLSDQLMKARMVIYTIDPRGVNAPGGYLAPHPSSSDETLSGQTQFSNYAAELASASRMNFADLALEALAEQTGGRAFYGRENVDAEAASSMAEAGSYYTISYYPKNHNFDGKFRRIEVGISKAGLRARTRDGYYALPDPPFPNAEETAFQLKQALVSPLNFSDISVRVSDVSLSPTEARGRFGIAINGKALGWKALANGDLECQLQLAAADLSDKNVPLHLVGHAYSFTIASAKFASLQRTEVPLSLLLAVDRPTDRVRIVVRDLTTGHVGSVDATNFASLRPPGHF